MTKHQADKRAAELNAMARRDEYKPLRTHAGVWFVARTFVAVLDDGREARRYVGITAA